MTSTVQSNRQKKGQQQRSAGDEEEIATLFPGPSLTRSPEKREPREGGKPADYFRAEKRIEHA